MKGKYDLPSWSVILEVLALPFKHTASNFGCRWMVLSWISNMIKGSDGNAWVDHLIMAGDENIPFVIFCHCEWSFTQPIRRLQGLIGFTLEDTCICCIGFLDFTNNDRLQLTARRLEVEICLETSASATRISDFIHTLCK